MFKRYFGRLIPVTVCLLGFALISVESSYAQPQTFTSGSTGADGALNYTTPGTYYFNPKTFNPPLDPAGDNIFNFTTINIASGVNLILTSKILTGPVYWLAQGAVTISGTINLSGETGNSVTNNITDLVPAAGGAGGYSGGIGGLTGTAFLPMPGNGPGGGAAANASSRFGVPGTFTGSSYLIPLIGGSGGGGGSTPCSNGGTYGPGGGGGGGAILVASSVSISLNSGAILANGGASGNGGPTSSNCGGPTGGGSGGAIRLIAPAINATGASALNVNPGSGDTAGGAGRIRVETFSYTGNTSVFQGPVSQSTPFNLALPMNGPSSIVVTSINGIQINANPFSFPDITVSSAAPLTVNVSAQYIPLGTVPKIIVMSETGDQTVNCSPLNGTLQQSACSASIAFPTGGSRGFVKATWQ